MVDEPLATMSNALFMVAFVAYILAMVAYFFRLAFTRVSAEGVATSTRTGTRIGWAGTGLAMVGFAVHAASATSRGLSVGRVPWGNMYEYSSMLALIAVGIGLVIVQRRMGYGHLMGFVLALAVLSMTSAILLHTEASPLIPALQSYWLQIHVSAMMFSSSVFMVAFAATALYLVKDTAEQRVAAGGAFGARSVGAAQAPLHTEGRPAGFVDEADALASGQQAGLAAVGAPTPAGRDLIGGLGAQRDALSPLLFPAVPFAVVAVFVLVVWRAPLAALAGGTGAALLGTATWYAVPYLPPAARLDNLAYRVTAFAFPLFTFGVMCGAIWAEEAWGRYWGWDPKETGSFFTWTLFAAYLHARSTHGWRGRRAAWIGVTGFAALMITYYAVNLWIVGLHSYAGV